jgi:YfiH family protein
MNSGFKSIKSFLTIPSFHDNRISHLFTTRLGGVSKNEFSSMNLGLNRGDEIENVMENFRIIANELHQNIENFVLTKQTHHDNIYVVGQEDRGKGLFCEGFSDVDGLITNEKNVVLSAFFADCVPVMFFDPVACAIGIVHSGWRGTDKKIAEKAVKMMGESFHSKAENILVGIGPSIGQCHFEIGSEVAQRFDNKFIIQKDGKIFADLWQINKNILIEAGIKDENITIANECTACNTDKYFSHRVLGDKRGNMAAFIALC